MNNREDDKMVTPSFDVDENSSASAGQSGNLTSNVVENTNNRAVEQSEFSYYQNGNSNAKEYSNSEDNRKNSDSSVANTEKTKKNVSFDDFDDERQGNLVHRKSSKRQKNSEDKVDLKRIFAISAVVLMSFLSIWGLLDIINSLREWRNPLKTPESATTKFVNVVASDNYKEFEKFAASIDGLDNPKELYDKLRSGIKNADGSLVSNFVLIRLENGKQYLCSLFRDEKKKNYIIRSIEEIPAEVQNFFAR